LRRAIFTRDPPRKATMQYPDNSMRTRKNNTHFLLPFIFELSRVSENEGTISICRFITLRTSRQLLYGHGEVLKVLMFYSYVEAYSAIDRIGENVVNLPGGI
jgi:hypothetical protein